MDKIKIVRRIGVVSAAIAFCCLLLLELWDQYKPREYLVWDVDTMSVVKKQQSNFKSQNKLKATYEGFIVEENIKFYAQVDEKIDWSGLIQTITQFLQGCSKKEQPQQPIPTNPPSGNFPAQQLDWGMLKIQANESLNINKGNGVNVCILDTGIMSGHPDLKYINGSDFTGSRSIEDNFGHGTHVAGIIAAQDNGIGTIGVAPNVNLYIGKVLGDDGSGSLEGIAQGIKWCVDQGAQIINMSLGGGGPTQIMQQVIQYALQKNVVIMAAAGNDSGPVNYPAAYSQYFQNVLAISATDQNDQIARFSSRGYQLSLSAPGVEILSTTPMQFCKICNGEMGWGHMSGTSMATPYATGVMALSMSAKKQIGFDNIGPRDLYGFGRINAIKSVK